jgi:hypothetical protein
MAKTKRVRKDSIVSTTMSYNNRVLLDTMADARGMTRSEYIRYLILADAELTTPRVVADAMNELLAGERGRPKNDIAMLDSFLINESQAEYGRLLREFGMFIGQDPIGNSIFQDHEGEPCIVWNMTAYNYDDFIQLSEEDRKDILTAKIEQLKDQEIANDDIRARRK